MMIAVTVRVASGCAVCGSGHSGLGLGFRSRVFGLGYCSISPSCDPSSNDKGQPMTITQTHAHTHTHPGPHPCPSKHLIRASGKQEMHLPRPDTSSDWFISSSRGSLPTTSLTPSRHAAAAGLLLTHPFQQPQRGASCRLDFEHSPLHGGPGAALPPPPNQAWQPCGAVCDRATCGH